MPLLSRSMFEKHQKLHRHDDNLHVQAISNPEEAAHIAALKLVMNTHLKSKLALLDTEHHIEREYLKTILNQKNAELVQQIIADHANYLHSCAHTQQAILGRFL